MNLLPCPFCGGPAECYDAGSDDTGSWWLAGCKSCGIWLPNAHYDEGPTQEHAVKAWNTRATLPAEP